MPRFTSFTWPLAALLGLAALATAPARAAQSCSVHSGATIAPVVELYTSEGCNSCPPADRWLSRLKAEPAIVALAFHVDYWDRLGWKDRFASPVYTQRQAESQRNSGARFSYTPQVIVDGADRPDWPDLGASIATRGRNTPLVEVALTRDGEHFSAGIAPAHGAPARLAAYWAVTEQGYVSAVKAGENAGVTLNHDFVVRDYRPVAAWDAKLGAPAASLQFDPVSAADPAHPREVNLVIVDAANGRPLQAVKLGC